MSPPAISASQLYSYPVSNDELIKSLNLQPHPEGGHFAVTYNSSETVNSPYAQQVKGDATRTTPTQPPSSSSSSSSSTATRTVQSTIYYLLSMNQDASDNGKQGIDSIQNHLSAVGVMHKNKSTTMHLHHTGRVVYTLISTTKPVQVKKIVMGEDLKKGEVRQLVVDGRWWKVSEIPIDDRKMVESGRVDATYVGCLISEVVTPGFDWQDHEYLTTNTLHDLLDGDQEAIDRYIKYCKD